MDSFELNKIAGAVLAAGAGDLEAVPAFAPDDGDQVAEAFAGQLVEAAARRVSVDLVLLGGGEPLPLRRHHVHDARPAGPARSTASTRGGQAVDVLERLPQIRQPVVRDRAGVAPHPLRVRPRARIARATSVAMRGALSAKLRLRASSVLWSCTGCSALTGSARSTLSSCTSRTCRTARKSACSSGTTRH